MMVVGVWGVVGVKIVVGVVGVVDQDQDQLADLSIAIAIAIAIAFCSSFLSGRYEQQVRELIARQESRLFVNLNDLRYVSKPNGILTQTTLPPKCQAHCQTSTLELGFYRDSLQSLMSSSSTFSMFLSDPVISHVGQICLQKQCQRHNSQFAFMHF